MMKINDVPCGGRSAQLLLQPLRLPRIGRNSVWFLFVGIQTEKLHRPIKERVVTLIGWQREVVEIRFGARREPIMIPKTRKKPVAHGTRAKGAFVRRDELVIVLADVLVDCRGRPF